MANNKDFIVKNGLTVGSDASVSGRVDAGNVTITSTDGGSSAGPDLILYRNSASPNDGDYLGQIQFKGRNDGPGDEIYAKVTGKIKDSSNGTEDGLIETSIKGGGSFTIVSRQNSDVLQLLNGVNLSVDGSISVGGTVDGRDIATDGSKLDGIESGATADQTASEILTAIKTVDGSGSGLDADTLDGQQGSYYQNAGNLNAGTLPAARLTEALGTYQIDPLISTNQGRYSSLNVPTMSMAAIVDPVIENKMQFQVPSSVEVSTDNGSTWSALSVSSNDLKDLVSGTGTGGGITISNQNYTQLRLTWNYSDYNYGYVFLNYLHYYTSPKRNTIAPTIEARDYTNQTFSTIESGSAHGGWPTHIWMPHNSIAFLNSAGRNDVVRITWDLTWDTGNSDSIQITKLNWYGTYPVANHNRVSSWDRDGNMTVTNGLSVTDNITVGGTVDGRDIAADGTKLDGIESGATADQTASEILTAIKTVDGSGSGLDADLLDGIHASGLVSNNYFQDNSGGGATGGGSDKIFHNNDQTVTTSYTIPTGQNSMTAGPISINSGVTVTVPSGSEWTIV